MSKIVLNGRYWLGKGYPFNELKHGESFFVPDSRNPHSNASNVRTAVTLRNRKGKGAFDMERVNSDQGPGVLVTRYADHEVVIPSKKE